MIDSQTVDLAYAGGSEYLLSVTVIQREGKLHSVTAGGNCVSCR